MLYFICSDYSSGTPGENRFDGLCKGIVSQGYKLTRVFLRPDSRYSIAKDSTSGIKYIYLWRGKKFHKGKYRHLQQIIWLYKFLKTVKSNDQIVVTHSDYLFVYSWFPKLHVYHEKSEYPELHLYTAPWLIRMIFKSYIFACKRFDGIFPISYALKDYFVSKGVKDNRIRVINMTVDPSRFVGLKKESSHEKYVAYCGAVSNFKDGVDILIRAFSITAERIQEVKLYIIGSFPFKKDQDTDFNLVKKLGLEDRVVFTGPIPRDDMPQMLKNAEVLVLARPDNIQAKYGFPTKLGEYLLTENPVVLTRVGDIPLFLKDGESAFIANPGDIDDIAYKMIEALTSPRAHDVGRCGASVAMLEFNSEIESRKITDFIYGK